MERAWCPLSPYETQGFLVTGCQPCFPVAALSDDPLVLLQAAKELSVVKGEWKLAGAIMDVESRHRDGRKFLCHGGL